MKKVNREQLVCLAITVENASYYSDGRGIDGAPYSCSGYGVDEFMSIALNFFATQENTTRTRWIRAKVRERLNNGEKLADEYCGNWWLWTLLNELGVSRVKS